MTSISRLALPLFLLTPTILCADDGPRFETLVYKSASDRDLHVDVFQPAAPPKTTARPAIAFFHGGGWVFGDRSLYHDACRHFARKGFVCLTFEYRLSRNDDGTYPHPAITPVESVKDARSAIRWIRANHEDLGIHTEKITAWGRSAGGQLALATVLCDGIDDERDDLDVSPAPNALLLFSTCYNTVNTWVDRMLGGQAGRIRDISPYHRLKRPLPPSLGIHGAEDTTEPARVARWFDEKVAALDLDFELVILPGRGHALTDSGEAPGEFVEPTILRRSEAFLETKGLAP